MKTLHTVFASLLAATFVCACGEIYTTSGGGSGQPSFDLSGTWSGSVGGISDDFKTSATYPLTVRLIQHGNVLTGSVYVPNCFAESPITSGRISQLKGTDLFYISFSASSPRRVFSFGFGKILRQRGDGDEVLDGLAGMTTDTSGCLSFSFPLGSATLKRSI